MNTKFTLSLLLLISCYTAQGQVNQIDDYKKSAIAYILKEHGDSAVYAAKQLLILDSKTAFHHYVASNAYRTLYMNYENSCSTLGTNCDQLKTTKEKSLLHVSLADSIARTIKPDSIFYLNAKASKYKEFGDTITAVNVFEKSLLIKPNQKDIYLHLIDFFIEQGQIEQTITYFNRMLELPGVDRENILYFIDLLIANQYYAEASTAMDNFQPKFPEDLTFHFERLRVSMALDDLEKANTACSTILPKLESDSIGKTEINEGDLYFLCGEARYRTKRIPEAIALYNQSLPYDSSGFFATRLTNIFEEIPGLYYEKYATEKAIQNKNNSASVIVNDFENAVANIQEIIRIHGNGNSLTPALLDSLGGLYSAIGDFQNARNVYIALLRDHFENSYKIKLAIVLYSMGDYSESKFYINKVLANNRKNIEMQLLKIFIVLAQIKQGVATCVTLTNELKEFDQSILTPEEKNTLCKSILAVCQEITICK